MSIEITEDLLEDLTSKAKCATSGPWQQCNGTDVFTEHGVKSVQGVKASKNDGWQIADCSVGKTFTDNSDYANLCAIEQKQNASYIAAVSPNVILALINKIRELTEANQILDSKANRLRNRSFSLKHSICDLIDTAFKRERSV